MKRIPAKIENKQIPTNGVAVRSIYIHILEDIKIEAGQVISISAIQRDSLTIMDGPEVALPYGDK